MAPEEMYTFHMVRLVVNAKKSILFLFRETDLYFVAFNPSGIPESDWFRFHDTPIPTFLKQFALPYNCSYSVITNIAVGHLSFIDIAHVLSMYSRENVDETSNERARVLQCTSLMFSETMRFGDIQLSVKSSLRYQFLMYVTELMDKKIHCWGKLGRNGMRYLCGESHKLREVEDLVPEVKIDAQNYELGRLVGRKHWSEDEFGVELGIGIGKGLLVLLFDEKYTINYMMNKDHMASAEAKQLQLQKLSKTKLPPKNTNKGLHKSVGKEEYEKEILEIGTASVPRQHVKMQIHQDQNYPAMMNKDVLLKQSQNFREETANAQTGQVYMEQLEAEICPVVGNVDMKLEEEHLDTLRGPRWITDEVIRAVFSLFSQKVDNDKMLLIPPSMSKLLTNPDTAMETALQLDLNSRLLVLVPVNDNQFDHTPGGAHWSLLVLDNTKEAVPRFMHHDSLFNFNWVVAQRVADVLRNVLPAFGGAPLVNADTPRQENAHDCGVYLLAAGEAVCDWFSGNHDLCKDDWVNGLVERLGDPDRVEAMRAKYLRAVESSRDIKKV